MKTFLSLVVLCCILDSYFTQGYYKTEVIRQSCLENELRTTIIYFSSDFFFGCIPSPFNEKCTFIDLNVRSWRCPGNSLPAGDFPGPDGGRILRCCTKEGLEIKSCFLDSTIYTFETNFVARPPKGFHLKGRFSVGDPTNPRSSRYQYCSLQRRH